MSIHDKDLLTGKTKLETSIERIKTFCIGKKTLVAAWRYYEHGHTITEKCMREKEVRK